MSNITSYKKCSRDCLDDCGGIQLSWEQNKEPINIKSICKKNSVLHKFVMKTAKQRFSLDHFDNLTSGQKEPFIYYDQMMRDGHISEHYATICKDFVKNYIAIVSVESPTDVVALTSKSLSVTTFEKVATLGGEIGLFTGFSMLTIIDILVYLYNMIWHANEATSSEAEVSKFFDQNFLRHFFPFF